MPRSETYIGFIIDSIHYTISAQNINTLITLLVAAAATIIQGVGCAAHYVRWVIIVVSNAELWDMFAMVMKWYVNRDKVHAGCCSGCCWEGTIRAPLSDLYPSNGN